MNNSNKKDIVKITLSALFALLTFVMCLIQDLTSLYHPTWKFLTFIILISMMVITVRLAKTIDDSVKNIYAREKMKNN